MQRDDTSQYWTDLSMDRDELAELIGIDVKDTEIVGITFNFVTQLIKITCTKFPEMEDKHLMRQVRRVICSQGDLNEKADSDGQANIIMTKHRNRAYRERQARKAQKESE